MSGAFQFFKSHRFHLLIMFNEYFKMLLLTYKFLIHHVLKSSYHHLSPMEHLALRVRGNCGSKSFPKQNGKLITTSFQFGFQKIHKFFDKAYTVVRAGSENPKPSLNYAARASGSWQTRNTLNFSPPMPSFHLHVFSLHVNIFCLLSGCSRWFDCGGSLFLFRGISMLPTRAVQKGLSNHWHSLLLAPLHNCCCELSVQK